MRLSTVALLLLAASMAPAQRYLRLPGSMLLDPGQVEFETQIENKFTGARSTSVGFGVLPGVEARVWSDRTRLGRERSYVDLSYALLTPVRGFGPGLTLSVLDAGNTSADGRRFLAMFTRLEEGVDDLTNPTTLEIGIGFAYSRHLSPIVGLRMPLHERFFLLAEFDGARISGGARLLPARDLSLAWFVRDDRQVRLSLSYTFRL